MNGNKTRLRQQYWLCALGTTFVISDKAETQEKAAFKCFGVVEGVSCLPLGTHDPHGIARSKMQQLKEELQKKQETDFRMMLERRGIQAAIRRGHVMERFQPLQEGHNWRSRCTKCQREVVITPHPTEKEHTVYGTALSMPCISK